MKNNTILIAIIAALVFGGGGFFAGMKYQDSNLAKNSGREFNRAGNRGQFGQRGGMGRPVAGEILSSDDKSITVKLQDGSSKIVLFSDKTQINKAAVAAETDLKVGEKVAVFGSENSDGSVTAQNIQLNPMFRGMGTPSASPK